MGFSVSGSAAIVFAAMFIAFGTFHSATTNSFERVSDARDDRIDRALTQQNTAVNVTDATWESSSTELVVTVENVGATELSVADVDLLTNNSYRRGYATAVEGDPDTDLWLPGETLQFTVDSLSQDPGSVKVVTGPGVAATSETRVI